MFLNTFLGRSGIDFTIHQNMGLVGGLLVTRAADATEDGRPNDTDIEFVTMFHVSCMPLSIEPIISAVQ